MESYQQVWSRERWEAERREYLSRLEPWVKDRLNRSSQHRKHPVYDFLFEYYSFRPAHLLRWSPGWGVLLEGATRADVGWKDFVPHESGIVLPIGAFPEHRLEYLRWAVTYLEAVALREPSFSCMGLHEWAMVYKASTVRHTCVPLRLDRRQIEAVVESQSLRCTHYDAFRFFTPAARPLNRWHLSRETSFLFDQPGCIHANMDLYRFAYKIAPFCPSEVLADAWELACQARIIDMRASPYDLRSFGLEPIPIETAAGRAEYVEAQRHLSAMAQPLRLRLLHLYRRLLNERLTMHPAAEAITATRSPSPRNPCHVP
ncbi:MAG: 3-methyladenine DNA glycosylase [Gemmataceae bacterium]|nr:3-methyladenine DNA glycosylase [Gemmataceae bacterium]MCS7270870.1 3-methyladenine DNA glycosylase [Gemmataceae bacterium]MDW8242680.1 3-methyladenine DNA glycosylase [Thermogemmata sp.]